MSEQKPSMKLSAVKLFNSLEDYNERLAFYNMMNDDENQSVLNVQPKQFVPELYHYGKITYDGIGVIGLSMWGYSSVVL